LAHDNSATSQTVSNVILPSASQPDSPPATPIPTVLIGDQEIRKFNHAKADLVRIFLAVYRVKSKNIDVVLSMNVPYAVEGIAKLDESDLNAAKDLFAKAAESLKIVNFGLFA